MDPGVHEVVQSHSRFQPAFAETVALSLTLGNNFPLSVVQGEAIGIFRRFDESRASNARGIHVGAMNLAHICHRCDQDNSNWTKHSCSTMNKFGLSISTEDSHLSIANIVP